ncbi:AraC family transcriptional regulator [Xylanibacter muris]|uniref:Helix-turn-helix transcriptional regulator n=1 Tax=Xylanibacter muris TaxID=2736290 RepID=A0ABX2ANU6_9BACT|nr:AraC family transcriptional regulator [Xylanibacter muris]NPD92911.1 helix-turn-helix transcriptional regulator [Xylanibacter muris]
MNFPIDELHLFTLNVGFARHDSDWNWKNVQSPFARLYLVVGGSAQIHLPDGIHDLTPGHLYFIPPFITHSYLCNSSFSHYYLHIYEKCDGGVSIIDEWDYPVEVNAASYDIELMKRLLYINPFLKLPASNPKVYDNNAMLVNNIEMNIRRPFCDKMESRGIVFVLLSRFMKYARPKIEIQDCRIRQSLAYIRKNLNQAISLDILADMACMSKDHFIRMFRSKTGKTPKTYIIKQKMERAELLLVTTDNPIKNVAMQVGYDDCSHFNKTFKAFSGMTPTEYRERHQ